MKRELIAEPDLETLADWDAEERLPAAALPALISAAELYRGQVVTLAGTGGIAAAVDTLWQLKRKPEGEATLDVVGRETEERTLAMRFDQEPLGWRILGDDDAQLLNSERRQVLELLREEGALTPAQIAAELGKSRPAVRMLLKRMKDDGLIKKQGAKYIPTHTMSYSVTESE